jgi:hypothetical protein
MRTTATTPQTIPPIAPADRLGEPGVGLGVLVPVYAGQFIVARIR